MGLRTGRFIAWSLFAAITCGGSLLYASVWGVPQWNSVFQGALGPIIAAYDGWALSIGFVLLGVILVGGSLALCWLRATFDFLPAGLGVLALLMFISLGLPIHVVTEIDAALSLVVVGLCALLVFRIFLAALRDRLARRSRI